MSGDEVRNKQRFSPAESGSEKSSSSVQLSNTSESVLNTMQNGISNSEKSSIQNIHSEQSCMNEIKDSSNGLVTESGTESQRSGQKSSSMTGSTSSEWNDKSFTGSSEKTFLKRKNPQSRQVYSNTSQEKRLKRAKNSRKQDLSSTDSSDGSSNTGSSSSSKNVSERGYAGSASSNEDSNETDQQTKKTSEKEKRVKSSNARSFSSSEIADFSSETIDSGSGCSTFLSCSDFSEETAKPNVSQQDQMKQRKEERISSNGNIHDSQDENKSDASLGSSSSLRALAPIRNYQSSKTSTPPSSHTSGKEEKRIDLPTSYYFVSFKKRKRSHSKSKKKANPNYTHYKERASSSNKIEREMKLSKTQGTKLKHFENSRTVPPKGDRFVTHQESLKRNFLDAFSSQKNQGFMQMVTKNPSKICMSSISSSSTSKNNETLSDKDQNTNHGEILRNGDISNPTPIYDIGSDIMAHVLSFLTHVEAHSFLITPLSKKWCETYMFPQDLWKILCLSPPFYVKVNSIEKKSVGRLKRSRSDDSMESSYSGYGTGSDQSEDTFSSYPAYAEIKVKHIFGIYRLLYSSFVKCVRYLDQIKEDSSKGRTPRGMKHSFVPRGPNGKILDFNNTVPIEKYLAALKGQHVHYESNVESKSEVSASSREASISSKKMMEVESSLSLKPTKISQSKNANGKNGTPVKTSKKKKNKPTIAHSKLTERLLGATKHGTAGPIDLPWSCAIYSVVNWMVAFIDVLGIQIMCLKVLPCLLEDEHQRTTAQRAGLTDLVLKGMVLFPDSAELHTAAFHTLVLLARPLGGKEGMLFHQTMVGDSSDILNVSSASKSNCCKNGIAVMLDSMRRFHANERLQAMSCWSMVNIALIASQKTMLVKLGGISVAANAMMKHPNSAEVQFRALFALINLAIPCTTRHQQEAVSHPRSNLGEIMSDSTEKEILDESVGQISNLVVVAMKNFCSSEAIMNRACLVLHNLSLEERYHQTLLWTPNCYQMLEWAMGNYRHDHVLQQSAGGTLQRLQKTLRNNRDLHTRFSTFIRTQQQNSLEKARREAQLLESQRKKANGE